MALLSKDGRFFTVGVDIFPPYLHHSKKLSHHDQLVLCDARNPPFKSRSFDVVIALEIVEHLEKQDGIKLIKACEDIARKKVVLSMPIGVHIQQCYDNNPYQEHKSTWLPKKMKLLGYTVKVNGIRGTVGKGAFTSRLPKVIQPLWQHFASAWDLWSTFSQT